SRLTIIINKSKRLSFRSFGNTFANNGLESWSFLTFSFACRDVASIETDHDWLIRVRQTCPIPWTTFNRRLFLRQVGIQLFCHFLHLTAYRCSIDLLVQRQHFPEPMSR